MSKKQLPALSKEARELKPGLYEHSSGKRYEMLGVARHSEDLTEYVVYKQLYGDEGLWVRPLTMFIEIVEVNERKVPRFRFISGYPETT